MVFREGKRSRLLATIGVTRGLGDHDLRAQAGSGTIFIKPFLSPQPEVRVLDVDVENITNDDVLVLATDGLWDVVSNAAVAEVVKAGLKLYEDADETRRRYRHISIAQVSRVFYRVAVLGWHVFFRFWVECQRTVPIARLIVMDGKVRLERVACCLGCPIWAIHEQHD